MKPETIKERQARRKRGAVRSVAFFILIQVACAVCFGALCQIPDIPMWLYRLFLGLMVLCLVMILPAVLVLRQRFKEIEGGEQDAAAEY